MNTFIYVCLRIESTRSSTLNEKYQVAVQVRVKKFKFNLYETAVASSERKHSYFYFNSNEYVFLK